jgi:hypothetical protein
MKDHPGEASTPPRRWRDRPWIVAAVLLAVLAVPMVTALASLHSPRWYPLGDLAQTELQVSQVGTDDTPLVGLAGRIGKPSHPGNHPGPASFYLLAPVYRLAGSSPFALQVSTVVLNLLAVGLALAIAARRGGWLFAVGTAAVLAVTVRSLGPQVVTEPWNPYLPVLWWVVILLAVWSVWCEDDWWLPVAVAAACVVAQTHVPYTGLVAVLLGATAVLLGWRAVQARRGRDGAVAPNLRAVIVAAAIAVLAWIPPVYEELTHTPGNLRILSDYFLGGDGGEALGPLDGASLWLSRLDPYTLFTGTLHGPTPGNRVVGALFLAAWVLAAVVAWRRRSISLVRLHQVTGLAALAGLVSMTRIYGAPHYYLVLWAWATTAVAVLAVLATAARVAGIPRDPVLTTSAAPAAGRRVVTAAAIGLPALLLLVSVGLATSGSTDAEQSSAIYSQILGELAPPTVAALREGDVPGGGDGPYEVRSDDPYVLGIEGYGMFHELRRAGIDARLPKAQANTAGGHRVKRGDQFPIVMVAIGPRIDAYRENPDAIEVASTDPRTPAQQREQAARIADVQQRLRAMDKLDEAEAVERNLMVLALDGDLPADVQDELGKIASLGAPAAVFILPPVETA